MIDTSNISVVVKPRDLNKINNLTGNLYNSVVVVSKRANALAKEEKEELILVAMEELLENRIYYRKVESSDEEQNAE